MSKIKMNCEEIYQELLDDATKREEVMDIGLNMIKMIKRYDEAAYNRLALSIHRAVYGPHFSEQMAMEAVANMKNKDGTIGGHWSIEQTTNLMKQHSIKANQYDWYYLLNMLYSDASRVFKNDMRQYLEYANDVYIEDIDGDEGKIFNEYVGKNFKLY